MSDLTAVKPFRLNGLVRARLPGPIGALLEPVVERALALDLLEEVYRRIPATSDPAEFARRALEALGARFRVDLREQFNIPAAGPVVVTANHPLGGLDGLLMVWLVGTLRKDFRILGNALLQRIPELAPCVLPIDVFGGAGSARTNAAALRAALGCLKGGGAVAIFPAGEVSHLRPGEGIVDPPWSIAAARLARHVSAPVVPVHFEASQGAAFHAAGLLHPRLRTVLLPRQLVARAGHAIGVRIGAAVMPEVLERQVDDVARTRLLRLVTHGIAVVEREQIAGQAPLASTSLEPAAAAETLRQEMATLPPSQLLAKQGSLSVWHAEATQIPEILREIGRLREVTFRAVGEGTGKATDLDDFDQHYQHLFLWDGSANRIAGAYRLGLVDRLLARSGVAGLYTHTLFRFPRSFLVSLGPAIELGRSFVSPEYQREFAPLMLLWKGIGQWIVRHPQYRTLLGPVSISGSYRPGSRLAMIECLRRLQGDPALAANVAGRHPPAFGGHSGAYRRELRQVASLDELDTLVAALEPSRLGLPVLLRQYLKLGARVVGFNVDSAFAHSVDCLVVADLAKTSRRVLDRYLGREDAAAFLSRHEPTNHLAA